MISGAYVLTDTIDKAFNAIFVDNSRVRTRSSAARAPRSASRASSRSPLRSRRKSSSGYEPSTGRGRDRFGDRLPDEAAQAGRRLRSIPEAHPRSRSASRQRPSTTASIRSTSSRAAGRRARRRSQSTRECATRTSPSATGAASRPSGPPRNSRSSESRLRRCELTRRRRVRDLRCPNRPDARGQGGPDDSVQAAAQGGLTPEELVTRIRGELGARDRAVWKRAGERGLGRGRDVHRASSGISCCRSPASPCSSGHS